MSKRRKKKKNRQSEAEKIKDGREKFLPAALTYLLANIFIWLLIGLLWLTFYFTFKPLQVMHIEEASFRFMIIYCLGLGSAGISFFSLIFRS